MLWSYCPCNEDLELKWRFICRKKYVLNTKKEFSCVIFIFLPYNLYKKEPKKLVKSKVNNLFVQTHIVLIYIFYLMKLFVILYFSIADNFITQYTTYSFSLQRLCSIFTQLAVIISYFFKIPTHLSCNYVTALAKGFKVFSLCYSILYENIYIKTSWQL